jgi:hypothetical protein
MVKRRWLRLVLLASAVLGVGLGMAAGTAMDAQAGVSHYPRGCTKARIIFDASSEYGTMDGGGLRCIGAKEAPCGNSF